MSAPERQREGFASWGALLSWVREQPGRAADYRYPDELEPRVVWVSIRVQNSRQYDLVVTPGVFADPFVVTDEQLGRFFRPGD